MDEGIQRQKAAVLKGLAHPVRLSIVEVLNGREICACEIADMFPYDRTTISKHLALLRNLGIVEDRKDGLKVYYRLNMTCLPQLLRCIELVILGQDRGAEAIACT